jgi:glycosyltransferase involved in cell wall biosynthesis
MSRREILFISHAGVLEVNRAPFEALGQICDAHITMIVPSTWKGDLITDLRYKPSTDDHGTRVIPLPVAISGNGSLFFFTANLKDAVGIDPDWVFVDEEPWSIAALQIFQSFKKSKKVFFTKQNLKKTLPFPFSQIEQFVFKHSEFAFSVAPEVSEVLLQGKGYPSSVVELPHSYDAELFKLRDQIDRTNIRKELGLSANSIVIGYFGRLTQEKGVQDLLNAIKLLEKETFKETIEFLFVGNGKLFEEIKEFSTQERSFNTKLTQAIPHHQVGRTLAAVDILIVPSKTTPSWKEQFGRILVEAMACGAAVIGSSSGNIPNLIQTTRGGFVFAEGDADDLAKKIRTLLLNPEMLDATRKAGNAYVTQRLTHRQVAKLIAESFLIGDTLNK